MKQYVDKLLSIIVITYVIMFIMSISLFLYLNSPQFNTKGHFQNYYMIGMNMEQFMKKYEDLCYSNSVDSCDYFYFQEPYHGKIIKVDYVSEKENHDSHLCSYFIPFIDATIWFRVHNEENVEIRLYSYEYSYNSQGLASDPPLEHTNRINHADKSISENRKVMNAFEEAVLSKVGKYERDDIHGMLCLYDGFFQSHFLSYCGILLVLVVIRIATAELCFRRKSLYHGDSFN